MQNETLFKKEDFPTRKRLVLMHVVDAGSAGVKVECARCGDTIWVEEHKYSITQFKKGIPCDECN